MAIDPKIGLLVAGAAAGAALLLGKKKDTGPCPPGSKLDVASGQCVYVQTAVVEVTGKSGDQKNAGGASESAELSYDYFLQAKSQWQKEAAQYANDATIAAEYRALMTLIEAATMFPDTAAGRASVDKLNAQIMAGFENLDKLRQQNATLKSEKAWGDTRLALAKKYDAASMSARSALTKNADALKETFRRTKDVVSYYKNRQQEITDIAERLVSDYAKVVAVVNMPPIGLASQVLDRLPSRGAFTDAASRLASIAPPAAQVDTVISGAPKVIAQLQAIRADFAALNKWKLTSAMLSNVANPGSAAVIEVEVRDALATGPGALFCGRASAVVSAIPVLSKLEALINDLELSARVYAAGLDAVYAAVDHAVGAERSIVGGGDGFGSSAQMGLMYTYLGNFFPKPFCPGNDCRFPENRNSENIKQQAAVWMATDGFSYVSPVKQIKYPAAVRAALGRLGLTAVPTPKQMFNMSNWGLPNMASVKATLQTIFTALSDWTSGSGILESDSGAPDAGEFAAYPVFDLTLVGGCSSDPVSPNPEPDYKTMTNGPDLSQIVYEPTDAMADTTIQGNAKTLKDETSVRFNGLRGVGRTAVREGNAGFGAVQMRAEQQPLRVSIAERVAVRGSGVSAVKRVGTGLAGLGHLGDPIQQILSPLMGLNGRRRR